MIAAAAAAAAVAAAAAAPAAGGRHPPPKASNPPPKAPKKRPRPRHFESNDEEAPLLQGSRASPRPRPSRRPRARAKPHTPPPNPKPPPLQERGRDPYGNVPGVGDTRYVPWEEGGNGGTVSRVMVLGDWDEELDPGEWWVVSQGSNGEGRGVRRGRRGSWIKRGAPSGWRGSSSSSPRRRRRPTSERPWRPGTTGTTGMTGMTRGTGVVTRGRGVTRGVR